MLQAFDYRLSVLSASRITGCILTQIHSTDTTALSKKPEFLSRVLLGGCALHAGIPAWDNNRLDLILDHGVFDAVTKATHKFSGSDYKTLLAMTFARLQLSKLKTEHDISQAKLEALVPHISDVSCNDCFHSADPLIQGATNIGS